MKALVVTNMWPSAERPESGIFVWEQVRALRRAGAEVDVFSFRGGSAAAYARAAARLARRRGVEYDVVHAHFGLSAWVALAAKAKVRAVTFHGTDLEHPRSRRLSLAALRFVDLPAAASAELAKRIPDGRAKRDIAQLPCGVALDRFEHTDRMVARTELGIGADECVALLPSDPARPEKHADRARMVAEAVGAHLITLGGRQPSEVPNHINAADLVLIPSEREGFGLALLEALACERPVISTPVGIAPQAVAGVDGATAAEWDSVEWIRLAKEALSLDVTVGGRKSAERWSSDACAQAVLLAWQDALDRSRG